ncbi:hypothetical protein CEXT_250961 [Caerostris extrusa]|uniref:Uncharacterized protein n=1 Tax=Caerostris extrusa TaxID=172846 RepID=A0AAV4PV53_CAEEX|nr:hypothetical protein CEXT_250961 [Caerostris extrusa]
MSWTPCIKRDVKGEVKAPTMIDVALALSKADFYEFTSAIQGISSYVHSFIGGDMETMNSPHDPVFILYMPLLIRCFGNGSSVIPIRS